MTMTDLQAARARATSAEYKATMRLAQSAPPTWLGKSGTATPWRVLKEVHESRKKPLPFRERGSAKEIEIQLEAVEISEAFLAMGHDKLAAISTQNGWLNETEAATEARRRIPALDAWLRRYEQRVAVEQRQRAAEVAKRDRLAPAEMLANLRARGVRIELKHGNIIAPAGAVLTPHEADFLRARKPDFMAILAAEAEAAKPKPPVILA